MELPTPKSYVAYRASAPITVDGDLSKSAWQAAPWTDLFEDIEGDIRPKPRYQTRAKMLWDETNFYIAAQLEEPDVWGTLTERDCVIFQDNDFEVFLDPDADSYHYAEFEINALGTVWDLLLSRPYKNGGMPFTGWTMRGIQTAVKVQGTLNDPKRKDEGWTVEIAIPWAGIKEICRCACPPHDGDQWRINFSRVEWDHDVVNGKYVKIPNRPEHNWVWSPQGVVDMHRPETWGRVQFSTSSKGPVPVREDYSLPARALLHKALYAAIEYRKTALHWPHTAAELGLDVPDLGIYSTPSLMELIYVATYPDGSRHEWHLSSEAAIWENESYELKAARGHNEFRPDYVAE